MEALNINNLLVNPDGRVVFSGLSTGIDAQKIVEGIITAKRIPIDTIETRITENVDKITALGDLRALLTSLRQTLSSLRGAITLDDTGNVFAAKQVFATTSRTDGATPAAAGNLFGVTTTNAATVGNHTIEILRTAASHKVASKTFNSETTALSLSGTFEVTGKGGSATITVSSTDTLQDVRDRINNANTGVNGTGVTANIVQTTATEFILVLTADDTGIDMVITEDEGGTVLSGLGISSTFGSGGYRNGLDGSGTGTSKIRLADGIDQIVFDGTQSDAPYEITYVSGTKVMTVTLLDGTGTKSDTYTLTGNNGTAETATFTVDGVGITIEIGTDFDKDAGDIAADANTFTTNSGSGNDFTNIKLAGSTGDISSITTSTLTINLTDASAATISVGTFTSGNLDFDEASSSLQGATQTITLTDSTNSNNTITIKVDVGAVLFADGETASIDLQTLENTVAAAAETNFDNELQTAQSARFTADGLIDVDRFESHFITSATNTLSKLAPDATAGDFKITIGADTVTVNYLLADTLSGLVTKINDAITGAGGGNAVFDASTAASLVTDGDGVRLVITNTSGAAITLTDTNGLVAGLGIDNDLVIERKSNTVSDLFDGITLSLFQAEEGTKIKLDIERDLSAAKTDILEFITAYNSLKFFINENSKIDSTTGAAAEDTGVLSGSSALFNISRSLSSVFSQATAGVSGAFQVLSQMGITFVDNDAIDDPLLFNTLEFDEAKLDVALLNNPSDVQRLFTFDFSPSDPRVSLLGFTNKTSFNTSGYTLNINFDDRYQSQTYTDSGSFTVLDATTGGPAGHGISIAFDNSLDSGNAYRYSYDISTETLTVYNLTTGTSDAVDITSILDAAAVTNGAGNDLAAGETASVTFASLELTLTLTGDGSPTTNFKRGTNIITSGAIDVASQIVAGTNSFSPATATVTYDNDGDVTNAVVTALKALVTTNGISYDAATGKLTIAIESDGANVTKIRNGTGSGVSFQIDGTGGFSENGTSLVDLEDGLAHSVEIMVGGQVIATVALGIATSTGAGTDAAIVIDVGTGLFSETSTLTASTAPMENYISGLTSGQFDIKDSSDTVIGTVIYSKADSLQDLAAAITANVANVTATVIASGGTFKIEILHNTRDTLTFVSDTGNLVSKLTLTNAGDGIFSANIDGAAGGADNGSVFIAGRTITALSTTGAEGLKIFFNGAADVDAVQLDFTTGFGERMFFAIDSMLTPTTGLMDINIATLTKQNLVHQERADNMLARLEQTRASLLQKFINMEVALASAQTIQASLKLALDAMFANKF